MYVFQEREAKTKHCGTRYQLAVERYHSVGQSYSSLKLTGVLLTRRARVCCILIVSDSITIRYRHTVRKFNVD